MDLKLTKEEITAEWLQTKTFFFCKMNKKTFDDARVKMIDSFTTKIQKKVKQTMGNTRLFHI